MGLCSRKPRRILLAMRVREQNEQDFPALEAIFRTNRGPEVKWLSPYRPSDDFAEQSRGELILVAEEQGQVVGFVSVWVPDRFIHHLYIHREHQGRGLGNMLVSAVMQRVPGMLSLKCLLANQRAMAFYLKTGWQEVSSGVGPDGAYALLQRSDAD